MTHTPRPEICDLPPVGELLTAPRLAALIDERGRDTIKSWVRDAVAAVREQVTSGVWKGAAGREALANRIIETVHTRAQDETDRRLGKVINATGVVLHTSLGRAPLSAAAQRALGEAAAACNLEVDLADGERRSRGYQLQSVWQRLTGAEAALVVNNNAAATLLMLDALCRGREVILSRGQLIEIGGSFRLPEIFAHSGAILHEVGTTNRTRLADYERAIGHNTAAILRVHPSNYRVVGFSETPETDELSQLAHRHGLLCLDDLGSGCLVDTADFGLPHEPTFGESLAAGADLALGSGDKLLGGPQSGILLGTAKLIERLAAHPLARAVRVDKLTLAALGATLESYSRGTAKADIPVLMRLGASVESLLGRAKAVLNASRENASCGYASRENEKPRRAGDAPRSPGCAPGSLTITVAQDMAPVGGGSLPGVSLPTAVLRITHAQLTADSLARRLRLGAPRVFARIDRDEVLLDLRSVAPDEDDQLVIALRALS